MEKQGNCLSNDIKPDYFLNNGCYQQLKGNEDLLKLVVVRYGAVAIALNTANTGFDVYSNGVFYSDTCSSDPKLADQALVDNNFCNIKNNKTFSRLFVAMELSLMELTIGGLKILGVNEKILQLCMQLSKPSF